MHLILVLFTDLSVNTVISQLQGYLQARERGAGPPPASSPTPGSSYPFSRAAFAAASLSTSVAWSVWL